MNKRKLFVLKIRTRMQGRWNICLCVCQCFVVHYFVSFLVCNHLEEEERAGCFAFIVLRMCCYCKCPVPHGARNWSALCDCGIS